MRMNKLLVPLAFSMFFNSGVAASTEPTDCYKMAWNDLGLTAGNALKLCSGTLAASETLICFMKAYGHLDEDGLGLTMGYAVNLCKSNSEPFRRD